MPNRPARDRTPPPVHDLVSRDDGKEGGGVRPSISSRSVWQTPQASILRSTSPSRVRQRTSRSSRGARFSFRSAIRVMTMARIVNPLPRARGSCRDSILPWPPSFTPSGQRAEMLIQGICLGGKLRRLDRFGQRLHRPADALERFADFPSRYARRPPARRPGPETALSRAGLDNRHRAPSSSTQNSSRLAASSTAAISRLRRLEDAEAPALAWALSPARARPSESAAASS